MIYEIYRLRFDNGIHIGDKNLEDANISFSSDTLFSALCHEAIKINQECLMKLFNMAKEGKILISNAFPYCGKQLYIPKPLIRIVNEDNHGNSEMKKQYKKLQYIPMEELDNYIMGALDVAEVNNKINALGYTHIKTSSFVRREEETLPYRIGVFCFNNGNGLYFIAGFESEDEQYFFEDLLYGLSYAGIGGKRASGLGRFELITGVSIDQQLIDKLNNPAKKYILLNDALPIENEMEKAIEDAQYMLVKKSGFVSSCNYSLEQRRKIDMYLVKAGSVFIHRFGGDVYDVSEGGSHPVYRYAKPMFLGVN